MTLIKGNQNNRRPLKVFYSYAHVDESFRDELAKHLKILERDGLLETWHDRALKPGVEWDAEIRRKLQDADIILLLVSSDFLASDYIWKKEVIPAIERHEAGDAHVIPVILRDCDWTNAPFGKLQALPTNANAIAGWPSRDSAYVTISKALRKLAEG